MYYTKAITIKQNGELRLIENEGIREDLPDIFYSRKQLADLLGLDESDGRNNKPFFTQDEDSLNPQLAKHIALHQQSCFCNPFA